MVSGAIGLFPCPFDRSNFPAPPSCLLAAGRMSCELFRLEISDIHAKLH